MTKTLTESGGTSRDLRIDFFRGLALYMIIFDHVPGDPLSKLTYARFGFSDAAEIFVFLSGVSCGIVYPRVLARGGIAGLLRAVSWRALQIYAYYLLASLLTILLIVVTRDVIAIPDNHQAFIAPRQNPLAAIESAIFLISPPALPGILVLYLELAIFFIPAFILIAVRSSVAALSLSASLWLLAQFYPHLLPRLADHSYFNPMAWQFIFCIGIFIGTWYNSEGMSLELFRKPGWVLLASIIVGVGVLYHVAHILAEHGLVNLGALAMSDEVQLEMKENLSAIRLLHFLSIAFLVALYVKPSSAIFRWPGASAIIQSGRSSLQVFCVGAVLSVMLNLFVAVDRPGGLKRMMLDCAAILLIAWFGTALIRLRPGRHQSPDVPTTGG